MSNVVQQLLSRRFSLDELAEVSIPIEPDVCTGSSEFPTPQHVSTTVPTVIQGHKTEDPRRNVSAKKDCALLSDLLQRTHRPTQIPEEPNLSVSAHAPVGLISGSLKRSSLLKRAENDTDILETNASVAEGNRTNVALRSVPLSPTPPPRREIFQLSQPPTDAEVVSKSQPNVNGAYTDAYWPSSEAHGPNTEVYRPNPDADRPGRDVSGQQDGNLLTNLNHLNTIIDERITLANRTFVIGGSNLPLDPQKHMAWPASSAELLDAEERFSNLHIQPQSHKPSESSSKYEDSEQVWGSSFPTRVEEGRASVFLTRESVNLHDQNVSSLKEAYRKIVPRKEVHDVGAEENYDGISKIRSLILSSNTLVNVDLIGIVSNLRRLDLSCNLIKRVAGIETLVQLEWLGLAYNRISSLEDFQRCWGNRFVLSYLDLRNNLISDHSTLVYLGGIVNLKELRLADNEPLSDSDMANPIATLKVEPPIVLPFTTTSQRMFVAYVLKCCPNLLRLDERSISEDDRSLALLAENGGKVSHLGCKTGILRNSSVNSVRRRSRSCISTRKDAPVSGDSPRFDEFVIDSVFSGNRNIVENNRSPLEAAKNAAQNPKLQRSRSVILPAKGRRAVSPFETESTKLSGDLQDLLIRGVRLEERKGRKGIPAHGVARGTRDSGKKGIPANVGRDSGRENTDGGRADEEHQNSKRVQLQKDALPKPGRQKGGPSEIATSKNRALRNSDLGHRSLFSDLLRRNLKKDNYLGETEEEKPPLREGGETFPRREATRRDDEISLEEENSKETAKNSLSKLSSSKESLPPNVNASATEQTKMNQVETPLADKSVNKKLSEIEAGVFRLNELLETTLSGTNTRLVSDISRVETLQGHVPPNVEKTEEKKSDETQKCQVFSGDSEHKGIQVGGQLVDVGVSAHAERRRESVEKGSANPDESLINREGDRRPSIVGETCWTKKSPHKISDDPLKGYYQVHENNPNMKENDITQTAEELNALRCMYRQLEEKVSTWRSGNKQRENILHRHIESLNLQAKRKERKFSTLSNKLQHKSHLLRQSRQAYQTLQRVKEEQTLVSRADETEDRRVGELERQNGDLKAELRKLTAERNCLLSLLSKSYNPCQSTAFQDGLLTQRLEAPSEGLALSMGGLPPLADKSVPPQQESHGEARMSGPPEGLEQNPEAGRSGNSNNRPINTEKKTSTERFHARQRAEQTKRRASSRTSDGSSFLGEQKNATCRISGEKRRKHKTAHKLMVAREEDIGTPTVKYIAARNEKRISDEIRIQAMEAEFVNKLSNQSKKIKLNSLKNANNYKKIIKQKLLIFSMTQKIAKNHDTITNLSRKLHQGVSELREYASALEKADQRIFEKDQIISDHWQVETTLKSHMGILLDNNDSLNNIVKELRSGSLKNNAASLADLHQKHEQALKVKDTLIAQKEDTLISAHTKIQKLKREIDKLQKKVLILSTNEAQGKALEKQLTFLSQDHSHLQQQIKNAQSEIEKKDIALRKANLRIEHVQLHHRDQQTRLHEEMESQTRASTSLLRKAEGKYMELKAKLAQSQEMLRKKNREMHTLLVEVQKSKTSAAEKLKKLNNMVTTIENECAEDTLFFQ